MSTPHSNKQSSDGWLRGAPLSDAISAGLRVPVMDDSVIRTADSMWHDDDATNRERYWIEQYQEQLAVTHQLRLDLSAARFDRDIYWPIAFCVGVACGMGLQWFA